METHAQRVRESRKSRVLFLRTDNKMNEIVNTRHKILLKSRFDNAFSMTRATAITKTTTAAAATARPTTVNANKMKNATNT